MSWVSMGPCRGRNNQWLCSQLVGDIHNPAPMGEHRANLNMTMTVVEEVQRQMYSMVEVHTLTIRNQVGRWLMELVELEMWRDGHRSNLRKSNY
jgi:hypothetical protein